MKILAIDVGIKNLALCYCEDGVPIEWCNEQLCDCAYEPSQNVPYILRFVRRWEHLFEGADIVVVERQMRVNMRIIEAVFQALFFDKTRLLSARSVKQRFGLSRRNYRQNKQAAVEYVQQYLSAKLPDRVAWFEAQRKKDDLADALLMALFFSLASAPGADTGAPGEEECCNDAAPGAAEAL